MVTLSVLLLSPLHLPLPLQLDLRLLLPPPRLSQPRPEWLKIVSFFLHGISPNVRLTNKCDLGTHWHFVSGDDDCTSIRSEYDLTPAQFYHLNPATGSKCTNLWRKTNVCVAGPGKFYPIIIRFDAWARSNVKTEASSSA